VHAWGAAEITCECCEQRGQRCSPAPRQRGVGERCAPRPARSGPLAGTRGASTGTGSGSSSAQTGGGHRQPPSACTWLPQHGRSQATACQALARGARPARGRGAARARQGRTDGRVADLDVELREQLALHVRLLHQGEERPGEHLRARVGARVRAVSARPGPVMASPACVSRPWWKNARRHDWPLSHKPSAQLGACMQDYYMMVNTCSAQRTLLHNRAPAEARRRTT